MTPRRRPARFRNGWVRFMARNRVPARYRPRTYRLPARYDPVRRIIEVVLSQGVAAGHWLDAEFAEIVRLVGAENLTAWIEHLREAETSIRRHRKRLEALRDSATSRVCPECGGPVTGRADAVYYGSTCWVRAQGHAPRLTPERRASPPGKPPVWVWLALAGRARGHQLREHFLGCPVLAALFICPSDHDQRQRSLRSTVVTDRAGSASPAGSGSAPIADSAL
jgi:hypothetical protein